MTCDGGVRDGGVRDGYILSNADDGERQRLASIERAYDPRTTSRLASLGVAAGARVLLVGAGGGSVVQWAAEAVGPDRDGGRH